MAGLIRKVKGWVGSPAMKLREAHKLIAKGKLAEAFPLLGQAAKAGLAEAEYLVARCYLEGAGVPPSPAEGARWLERAANQGYAEAQTAMAGLFLRGATVVEGSAESAAHTPGKAGRPAIALFAPTEAAAPDFVRAAEWARKASDSGSADGKALLAFILTSGPEEMRDLDAALDLYRASAAADCAQGCLGLGLALLRVAQTPPQLQEVAGLFRRAADLGGLGTAMYLLGLMIDRGDGVAQDVPAAVGWYKQAALRGMRSAQARYGLALMQGNGVKKDTQEGESWLRRAAL